MIYTAQNGEDRWLEQHWSALGLPDRGTFCEVGACDGVSISNTFWLENTRGWHGVLVEPGPTWTCTNRPRSIYVKCAAGPAGIVTMHSGGHPELTGIRRTTGDRFEVASFPLTDILSTAGLSSLDVLSVDTEGTEVDVLGSLDWKRYRPKVVFCEWDTSFLPPTKDALIETMLPRGYALAAVLGCNLAFIRWGE